MELKKFAEGEGVLSKMQELNAARLSVSKVSEKEWDFIMNELILGYDEVAPPAVNGDDSATAALPNGTAETPAPPTIESDVATTDTFGTAANSSRPESRAGSKKPASRASSRQPAARPTSRAASLAPPRATSRGRSRTPRAGNAQPMAAVAEEMEVVME